MTSKKISSPKPVRLQDVATAAGTSLATASLALNGKGRVSPAKQLEIRRIAQRLGFEAHPSAQRLATGRNNSAQVELFTRKLDLGVATLKLQIIQGFLAEKGYRAPIHASGKDAPIELVRHLRRQRPLAMVCHAAIDLPAEVVQELQEYVAGGGCLVAFDLPSVLDCDQVVFDRADSADRAVTHLLELGHRDISFASVVGSSDVMRIEGTRRALERFGLTLAADRRLSFQPTEMGGTELARQFVNLNPRPSAICISDDAVAAAFVAEIARHGVRVPDEVSVVGHDDLPIATHSYIPLTTVSQPLEAIARATVELLTSRLEGHYEGAPRTVQLCGELIARQSSASLPANSLRHTN